MRIGQKIRLKSYEEWNDYKRHKGEVATVIEIFDKGNASSWDVRIVWEDGSTSSVKFNNIISNTWKGKKRCGLEVE